MSEGSGICGGSGICRVRGEWDLYSMGDDRDLGLSGIWGRG